MKLIIQSDDYGISEGVSTGIIKGIKEGVITCTGLFANMPSSSHAADLIKNYPHVCLGIDLNYVAGRPCAKLNEVSSLVDKKGMFYDSRQRRMLDKECVNHDHMNYEETLIEAKAQVDKFIELVGKKPEYIHGHAYSSPTVLKVQDKISELYQIPTTRAYQEVNQLDRGSNSWYTVPFGLEDQMKTSTKDFITQDQLGFNKISDYGIIVSHCGYVDAPLLELSSFTIIRTKDLEAMLSLEIKEWLAKNNIELISYRDLKHHPISKTMD